MTTFDTTPIRYRYGPLRRVGASVAIAAWLALATMFCLSHQYLTVIAWSSPPTQDPNPEQQSVMVAIAAYRLFLDANGAQTGNLNPAGFAIDFQRDEFARTRFPERRWYGRYAWFNGVWPWGGTYYVHGAFVLLATAPVLVLAVRSFRRMPGGQCVCGYDLRATPERCPECGRAVHDGPRR